MSVAITFWIDKLEETFFQLFENCFLISKEVTPIN